MLLARIEGNATATRKHRSFHGWRILICQPVDGAGVPFGAPRAAIDPHGAALHQTVLVSSDGAAARQAVGDPKSPVRDMVIAIVDDLPARK